MANLERVHRGYPDRPVVVFIHGLGGHMFDTWVGPGTSADDCWPHWVGRDTECDTLVLGYDAAISRWQDQAMSLIDQGIHLAHQLATHPDTAERELVLVGHSMGGLLIKKMIVQGQTQDDPTARAVAQQVRGVVFVATPHQGAELASLVQALSRLTRPNPQMEALRKDDSALLELNRQFRVQRNALAIDVLAFAERRDVVWKTSRIPLLGKLIGVRVVSDSSSDPGLNGVAVVPLPEDHFSICKPGRRDSLVHTSVCRFVAELVASGRSDRATPPPGISARSLSEGEASSTLAGSAVSPIPPTVRATLPPARLHGPFDNRLQPVDNRFYGREAVVAQVLAFLRSTDDAVVVVPAREVSGPGGIGKTEVCKAALKAWLAVDTGAVAWYLSLPDSASVADLLNVARRGLALGGNVETPDQLLQALPAGLYYLDNLEGVSDSADGARLMRAWAEQPGVRLLVSSRVSLPSVFGRTVAVDRLPDAAALRLFRESWDGDLGQVPASDQVLGAFVLDALGAHPLSIVLCGRLGNWCSYAELLSRWREQGTRTVHDPQHPTPRLGSLDASLGLTARALAQRDATALSLWTACALFHGGVDDETLAEIEERGGWGAARPWLVRHHVLSRDVDGRWAMLPPLSRHALDAAVKQRGGFDWDAARRPLVAMFAERVAVVKASFSSDSSLAARRWLIGRFDTLARLMQRDMDGPAPDDAWLRAMAVGLRNLFQFNVIVAKPLLSALNVRFGVDGNRLLLLGDLEMRLGELGKARELHEQALALFKKESDGLGQANTLMSLGKLQSRLGEVGKARAQYEEALAFFKKEGVGLGQANTLKSLGDLEMRLGELGKARELHEQALALFKKESVGLGQANTLKSLGDLEMRLGEVGKARELYEQALTLFKKESASLGQANTLHSLGGLEMRLGELGKARELYEQGLVLFKKESDGLGQANTLKSLGDLEARLGEVGKAREQYEQALALFKKESENQGQANTLHSLGDLEMRLGEVSKAREQFEQALALFKKASDGLGQANTLRSLGDLERRQGDVGKARELYEHGQVLFKKEGDGLGQANTLKSLGDLESQLGEVGKARELYVQALALFKKESNGLGQANTLRSLGNLERRLGQVGEARELYEQALALFKKESAGLGQANTLKSMGDQLRQAKEWAAAVEMYQQALALYANEQEPVGRAYAYAELARCLHAMQQAAEADQALESGVAFAVISRTDQVEGYVFAVVSEIKGGSDAARNWVRSLGA